MESEPIFPGFRREYKKDYFKYPLILEEYWPILNGYEQKALDYIMRRTIGFSKVEDSISLSQFAVGAGKRNRGAGISKSTAKRCLESLEKKGFIILEKRPYRTTVVKLRLVNEEPTASVVVSVSPEVSRLIELFRPIAGHRAISYAEDKKQVAAIQTLIQHYGVEATEQFVKAAVEIHGTKFAPTITSPVMLEKKLPELVVAMKRKRSGGNDFKVVW